MKTFAGLLILLALGAAQFAATVSQCNSEYDQCITQCCGSCGSTLDRNTNGDLVCNLGDSSNPNQACINACTPCSTQYQQCSAGTAGSSYVPNLTDYGNYGSGSGCCGSALVLAGAFVLAARCKVSA